MVNEVFSGVGAQDMDTSVSQVYDLDHVEFYWEKDQLDVNAVFRPGIATLFSPTAFGDIEKGGSAKNTILLDEEEDKKNSPPTTPVSEKLTRLPAMLRSRWKKIASFCLWNFVSKKTTEKVFW